MELTRTTHLSSDADANTRQEGPFNVAWSQHDQNALLPSHLALPRAQRAWDRKPKSPYSRGRFKVGKLWKRQNPSFPSFSVPTMQRAPSPVKAVKKLCFDSGFGMASQVRDWEARGSPMARRRIVTRAIAAEEDVDDLIALSEDDETVDEACDDITVQIFNEDGTIDQGSNDDAVEVGDSNEWSDIGEEEQASVFDDTLMHLNEAANHPSDFVSGEITGTTAQVSSETTTDGVAESSASNDRAPEPPSTEASNERGKSPVANAILPPGFVSPAVPRTRRTIKSTRSSLASRRKTLPINFTPVAFPDSAPRSTFDNTDLTETGHSGKERNSVVETSEERDEEQDVDRTMNGINDEEEWEDVETSNEADSPNDVIVERAASAEGDDIPSASPHNSKERSPSPIRRSPRRKSSSPMKGSSIWPESGKSHLIAFTPIKMPIFAPLTANSDLTKCSPVTGTPSQVDGHSFGLQPAPWTRSSSAPPEEHQVSPQKSRQPRISDDTALLQAFLNRAAESRTSRRLSETARRESLENRRDSDSVRRALADTTGTTQTPAPPAVLMDLDPNSPSPRKASFIETSDLLVNAKREDAVEDDDSASPTRNSSSRRSGRVKKKPEILAATTYSAPNKISIRSNTDPIVLKRSEAQEMALLTRNNTRKNKGGSVLPPLRLAKLGKETSPNRSFDAAEETGERAKPLGRSVQWAETLVAFHHFVPDVDESNTDENTGAIHKLANGDTDDTLAESSTTDAVVGESSSKPRARRPKQARIAPTSPKDDTEQASTVVTEEPLSAPAPEETPKPQAVKRKSRIATPAKVRGKSLLSTADEPEEISKVPAATSSNRKPVSKLPAPTALSLSGGPTNGKESSLIFSPPKKRARPAMNVSSSKAPVSKLDLTNPATTFDADRRRGHQPVGLASPAKKPSTAFLFGTDGGESSLPGLASPAKKRSRRNVR